jgi:hypothetical protein
MELQIYPSSFMSSEQQPNPLTCVPSSRPHTCLVSGQACGRVS